MEKSDIYILNKETNVPKTKKKMFKTGFEIEFNSPTDISDICSALEISEGKGGKTKIIHEIGKVRVEEDIDLFEKESIFAYGYNDGSVNCEIVSNVFNEEDVYPNMKEAYKQIDATAEKPDFFAKGKGGLHQTFINGTHKDNSVFTSPIAHTTLRFFNAFYDSIILAFGNGNADFLTRQLYFRQLRESYQLVRPKTDTNKKGESYIWGLEFRFPDGTDSPEACQYTTDFCSSVLDVAFKLTDANLKLYVKQKQYEKQKLFFNSFSGTHITHDFAENYYKNNKERLDTQNKIILEVLGEELKKRGVFELSRKVFDFETRFKEGKKTLLRENLTKFYDKKENESNNETEELLKALKELWGNYTENKVVEEDKGQR